MQEDGGVVFQEGVNGVILGQWMKKEKAGSRRCVGVPCWEGRVEGVNDMKVP